MMNKRHITQARARKLDTGNRSQRNVDIKTGMKTPSVYCLIMALGMPLSACQSNAPKLNSDKRVENQLENPQLAEQVPEKLDNITLRTRHINGLLADADDAKLRGLYDEAERIYGELDAYDPNNLRVQHALSQLQKRRQHDAIVTETEALLNETGEQLTPAQVELALATLHPVLLENPQYPPALAVHNRLLAEQARLQKAKSVKKLAFNQPVTMEFRDVSIKTIFQSLAHTTNINFVLDKDIPSEQKATIYVKSMAFNDALDLLLQSNQLEKKVLSEHSVMIYVNDVLHQREYKDLSVRSYTLDYADAKQMTTILRSMLNLRTIETDARLNTLLIKDSPEILQLAEKIIYAQDKPDAEVMLELQVMEVKRSYLQRLGVQTPNGLTVPVPASGVLTVKDLNNVTSNALVVNGIPGLVFNTTNGDANLLANPRIRVKNKDVAKIHIGEKVPVFTSNVASTGVSSETIQYIDAGLKLEVEPSVSSNEDITIKINLNVGSIGDKVTSTAGGQAFRVGTRFTSTQLRLHDGETQVLAGLIDDQDRKNVSGIPGLSSLPIIGRLFSNHTDDKSKTEIILTVTPHIIRPRTPQAAHEAEIWTGSEGQAGRQSPAPALMKGAAPFMVPKAPPAKATGASSAPPPNLNIALPPGFALGGGLAPGELTPLKDKAQ